MVDGGVARGTVRFMSVRSPRVDVLLAERPAWRGLLHTWAFWLTIPSGVLLIVFADRPAARVAAAIYAATLLLVFGTSAAYHRLAQSYEARRIMQRIDHSMIYLLIAGTYVPICLVALPRAWGVSMLSVVGAMGLVGIVLKLVAFARFEWVSYALYPLMGWVAVFAGPVLADHLTGLQLALVVGGGVAYTVGFPILLLRRPDPWPKVFGYHEIWHGFTVLAAMLHFGAVALLVA
jgi:hemolysin III